MLWPPGHAWKVSVMPEKFLHYSYACTKCFYCLPLVRFYVMPSVPFLLLWEVLACVYWVLMFVIHRCNSLTRMFLSDASAGVGRTGTFILVDHLLQRMREHRTLDIFGLVLEMRNYRCNMLQTEVLLLLSSLLLMLLLVLLLLFYCYYYNEISYLCKVT